MKKLLILMLIFTLIGTAQCLAKEVKGYYPTHVLKFVEHYNSKGQLTGWYKYYYPNGQLKEEGVYKDDKLVRVIKRYYPDGSPIVP